MDIFIALNHADRNTSDLENAGAVRGLGLSAAVSILNDSGELGIALVALSAGGDGSFDLAQPVVHFSDTLLEMIEPIEHRLIVV